jgi:NarL family two-component system response regulator YdfI
VLSSSDERSDVCRALRAGACGYMLKTADGADIRDAIKRVAAGDLVFPSDVSSYVLAELRAAQRDESTTRADGTNQLTTREREILELMAEGCSNQAVADRLHVSLKTVEAHTGAIFSKLGVDASRDGHRRVLAVVTYLKATRAAAK